MRILYFGTYDPAYPRNRVILRGLRENGISLQECNDQTPGLAKYVKLAWRLSKLYGKYDLIIVGFPGHYAVFIAKLFSSAPIVLDLFTSHYEGYVLDRQTVSAHSFRAWWYRWLDRRAVKAADITLLDTQAHLKAVAELLHLPPQNFKSIYVGTDSQVFKPSPLREASDIVVHFHGHYIPLQGVEHIIRAAKILEESSIRFRLIGRGQTFDHDRALAQDLKVTNIEFHDQVPYEKLADMMAESDMCLGIFGDTPKSDVVIPNKVFEALASARPVITSDTPAARELLQDGETALLCRKADPEDLAQKIRFLAENPEERKKLARNGAALYMQRLEPHRIGEDLIAIIHESKLLRT